MAVANHRCAVLGKPIAHSLSPVLHRAAYRALGLDDWDYDRHEVGEDDLDTFLHSLNPTWVGLSLTMPLKKTIQPYGDPSHSWWAQLLGVANTAVFDWSVMTDDGLPSIALYNTDVMGIVLAFDHARRQIATPDSSVRPAHGRTAVILGNGNTAMSALAASSMILDNAIDRVIIAARHPDRNQEESTRIATACGLTISYIPLDQATDAMIDADIIISTLPAHAADGVAETLSSGMAIRPHGMLLDVIYDPRPTALMSAWSELGATAIGGQEMLLYQAILQVSCMTGTSLDVLDAIEAPMRQALEAAL